MDQSICYNHDNIISLCTNIIKSSEKRANWNEDIDDLKDIIVDLIFSIEDVVFITSICKKQWQKMEDRLVHYYRWIKDLWFERIKNK